MTSSFLHLMLTRSAHGARRLASWRSELYSAAALIVAVVFFVSLRNAPAVEAASPFDPQPAEQVMWGLLNNERVQNGVPALIWDETLHDLAEWRSGDMISNDYFSHSIPSCGGCAVYGFYTQRGLQWSNGGENIAWNSGYSDSDSPVRAHAALMNSSGHRANILNPAFTHGAIGAAGANGISWQGHLANPRMYTQLFMTAPVTTPPPPTAPSGPAPVFNDIAGSAFQTAIAWAADAGVTNGCGGGRFCPTDPVTREQMASFLVRVLGLPPSSTDYFSDDAGSQHQAAINALAASGITRGCGGDSFCPGQVVTREQMAAFLSRAYSLPATAADLFDDDASSPFQVDINRLGASGITNGCDYRRYCGSAAVNREQMVAFLYRAEH